MSDIFYIKRGANVPSLRYVLTTDAPDPIDLTGATVTFRWRKRGSPTSFERAATIVTPTGTPTVQHDWELADTETAGSFDGEFWVEKDGLRDPYPNVGFIHIQIGERV